MIDNDTVDNDRYSLIDWWFDRLIDRLTGGQIDRQTARQTKKAVLTRLARLGALSWFFRFVDAFLHVQMLRIVELRHLRLLEWSQWAQLQLSFRRWWQNWRIQAKFEYHWCLIRHTQTLGVCCFNRQLYSFLSGLGMCKLRKCKDYRPHWCETSGRLRRSWCWLWSLSPMLALAFLVLMQFHADWTLYHAFVVGCTSRNSCVMNDT